MNPTASSRPGASIHHLARVRAGREKVTSTIKTGRRRQSVSRNSRKSNHCKDQRATCWDKSSPRYQSNQQYTITAITNASGSVMERYSYTAYGKLTIHTPGGAVRTSSTLDNRYTYTGREWDEDLELYHYRARMYDPVSGRFCSRDPIGFPDGSNSYANYFLLGHVDPTGLAKITISPSIDRDQCSECGNFDWLISYELTIDGEGPVSQGVYAVVQEFWRHRTSKYCTDFGCPCTIQVPGFTIIEHCDFKEILGFVKIEGRDITTVPVLGGGAPGKIVDHQVYTNNGEGDCHSFGWAKSNAEVYLVPITQELRQIGMVAAKAMPCGDRTVTVLQPGPQTIDRRNAIAAARVSLSGEWDCCPKRPGIPDCSTSTWSQRRP